MNKALTAILAWVAAIGLAAAASSAESRNENAQKAPTEQSSAHSTQKDGASERKQYVEDAKDGRGVGTDWSGRKDQDADKSQGKLERH